MKVKEFAALVNGEIIGDPEQEITGVAGIREAKAGDITLVSSAQYRKYLSATKASCVIVQEEIADLAIAQVRVKNAKFAYARALECFYRKPAYAVGTSPKAFVADTATIGKDVSIYPFAYVSDHAVIGDGSVLMPGTFIGEHTQIGRQCLLYPNVTVREGIVVGDRVTIHAGTVIGSDGFGYVFEQGEHYKVPQVGGVIIGDDVEIGANVSIDRATTGNTRIGRGSKIDNLVQIAHNVTIGEKSLIVAQVGIAGSAEIGDFVIMGGQSAAADHSVIASGTMIAAQSGTVGNLSKGVYSGSPALPHSTWLRAQALFSRLPEMHKRLKGLEARIETLEKGEAS